MMLMSTWADDDLMMFELKQALRETEAVTERSRAVAHAAFAWRSFDAELMTLVYDSSVADEVLVRGSEVAGTRSLSFEGAGISLEVEVDDGNLLGQVVPACAGRVTLIPMHGRPHTVATDAMGFFSFTGVGSGPVRFSVELQGPNHATGWLTL
jgi:hypothetical protein